MFYWDITVSTSGDSGDSVPVLDGESWCLLTPLSIAAISGGGWWWVVGGGGYPLLLWPPTTGTISHQIIAIKNQIEIYISTLLYIL